MLLVPRGEVLPLSLLQHRGHLDENDPAPMAMVPRLRNSAPRAPQRLGCPYFSSSAPRSYFLLICS